MAKTFTEKQKEIMARKLGYDGPMTEFEKFVKSDPAMERKYNAVVGKLMARKGAYVTKMAVGGTTQPAKPATPTVTAGCNNRWCPCYCNNCSTYCSTCRSYSGPRSS
jgi:hypothetical protein